MGKGRRRIFFQKVKKGIVFGFDSRSGIYHVHSYYDFLKPEIMEMKYLSCEAKNIHVHCASGLTR